MHHRYSVSNTQHPDTGKIVTTTAPLAGLKMDQFVERLFASDTEGLDTRRAAGRKVSTCGSERLALLQADAHTQLVPLLSSIRL